MLIELNSKTINGFDIKQLGEAVKIEMFVNNEDGRGNRYIGINLSSIQAMVLANHLRDAAKKAFELATAVSVDPDLSIVEKSN